jgi:hypothetical protein
VQQSLVEPPTPDLTPPGTADFDYYVLPSADAPEGVKSVADPRTWVKEAWDNPPYPVTDYSYVFRTRPGVSAHAGIVGITTHRFRGECLGAIEICILRGADVAIGWAAFNKLHPGGLHEIGLLGSFPGMSIYKHVWVSTGQFTPEDMVPGDWVYLKNDSSYKQNLLPGKTDYWNGENAPYMGRYDKLPNGAPSYEGNASPEFSGMGLYDRTEDQLRADLAQGYRDDTGKEPNTADIYFSMVAHLKTGTQ